MARYWVGDAGEPGAGAGDPAPVHPGPSATCAVERERIADAVRRTLAGNVTADDPD